MRWGCVSCGIKSGNGVFLPKMGAPFPFPVRCSGRALKYNGQSISLRSRPVAVLYTASCCGNPLWQVCFVHSLRNASIRQGFVSGKVVPHEIPPRSDEPFFDLACRSCAKWALNLMQATACLRSAPASERAAAQPNSLTLQPARLIQVTPPRSRCISLRHLMLAVRINSRDTFGGSRWSRNRLRH